MIGHHLTSCFGAAALLGLLAGCSGRAGTPTATDDGNTVTVTTVLPQHQTFHDTIEAVGTAMGDPHRARTLSLAYGGQIMSVTASAGQRVQRGQPLLTVSADPATRQAYQQAQAAWSWRAATCSAPKNSRRSGWPRSPRSPPHARAWPMRRRRCTHSKRSAAAAAATRSRRRPTAW